MIRNAHDIQPARSAISGLVCLGLILLAGCSDMQNIPVGTPQGWESSSNRWWQTGVDTTEVFRNLETMDEMGIPGSHLLNLHLTGNTSIERDMARRKVAQHVKISLIPLFRNHPEIVDSLFNKYVFPRMSDVPVTGDVQPTIQEYKRKGYRILTRHFRPPHTLLKLGEDIPVPVPDSLTGTGIRGSVSMQVYIDREGVPLAIEKLDTVHPVLDAIAMRATTRMRWQPAYLLKGGKARQVPSWARFRVNFSTGD